MPDSQDFNTQKDINRYLQQQGRAPQSHLDWETWRKIGQPGTYQSPPGSNQRFQGVSSGAGGPSYNGAGSNYDMFKNTGDAIAKALEGPTSYVQEKFAKMGKDKPGSTASSRNGSNMADDDGSMGPPIAGGGRSQNASITSPANSRGMRRGRRGDFSGALAAHNITMVQGNDNYGTVNGNMGGANVGNGDYDNSFQSKNSGGRQTAFSGNNSTFGGGSPTPPVGPTTPTPPLPPPTPPVGPTTPTPPPPPPTTPGGPYPPPPTPNGPGKPPKPPVGPGGPPTPPQIGAPPVGPQTPVPGPVGPQTPVQGPQQPGRPAIGPGPQPMGQLDESNRTKVPDGLYAHANDPKGGPESDTARQKLNEKGVHGPWLSQTAGPKAPAPAAPAAPAGKFKSEDHYMGIPVKGGSMGPGGKAKNFKGDQTGALPQFARMAQASFVGGQPSAVQKSAGANSKPAPAKKAAAPKAKTETVEGPKSVASKAPAKKAAAKTKEKK